jgi:hypothetical protein
MLQGNATDFSDRVGLAKIDNHIAILHHRFDRIAKIASRGDVDLWIVLRKINDGLAHAPGRANQQHANARQFHASRTLTKERGMR